MENRSENQDDTYRMLSESGYSDKAIAYFQARENIGCIENADQITEVTGPCGDTMKISLSINKDRIMDAKIQVLGCPGAVASGSAVVDLAKGMSLDEAENVDMDQLYRELEKMPDQKVHCARLAIKTLQKAVQQYRSKETIPAGKKKEIS
ncbi:MAG: iron-sulfur cluster assembly scaffold protein [Deltaproteobacteria bacterium]|nr:iron-sulfur cluster assembly scaffold protein [Deltaproteobacteria bacterium]MBW1923862.1 iron-sulfur cluster assembly scaffold protein [Deltaproteobacteria bacterium]MBW1949716.1 iron-sulfur cluster assembly scaffold protein [Deltaproteobacteria bacterium]MBW2008355.1 iron-sulfur cluster assembly scaffold protein [Deltaproteobacteria bacterium]MBW2102100.1 iron-sulfur cluster assembly scaffold protein [Deltaproteobacteria bacterium]